MDGRTRRAWTARRAALACALLAAGCVPGRVGSVAIFVSLRTDFVPAEEFAVVRVELAATDGRRVSRDEIMAEPNGRYLDGVGILEAVAPPGPYLVDVSLVGRGGGTLARRRVALEAFGTEPHAVTVLVTRGSIGCDEASCAEGETCGATGCVDAHCTPETPETCPTECIEDRDCPAPAACASPACASGTCLYGSSADACGAGEFCDPADGCIPRTTPVGDVGTPCEGDAECADGPCVDTGAGESACTRECDSASDCMRGWTCGPDPDGGADVCLCTAVSPEICSGADEDCDGYVDEDGACAADVGTECEDDGEVCASTVCVDTGDGRGACTMLCRTTGDCPAGWTCGDDAGAPTTVCLCTARAETCDGEDDDCDGSIDEAGACASPAGPSCAAETCNLADDDCDGFCDDGASCRRPVHRGFHPGNDKHLYSISLIEITNAPGLDLQSADYFHLYVAPGPGLAPLHRCYWPDVGSHLLTVRPDCEGAVREGVIGYVATGPVCGARPLFELRSAEPRADYFYTISGPERSDLLRHTDMRDWGIAGWVWASESRCTTPAPEDCANGRDDDCDGLTDCEDAFECCSSGSCGGYGTPAAYRIRCCQRGWVNIARSEKHCGGCFTQCRGDFLCITDRNGSGHCDCTAETPMCPRGQQCQEQIAPNSGMLDYRCSCTSPDHCANGFACRSEAVMDGIHNICHPTL